ncbi:MAG: D-mannonate epimerase [Planctomycetes bacterium]|nr:D-mannonate epimerase [Planctomycetota bacterium]
MSETFFAHGSPTTVLSDDDLRRALTEAFARIGTKRKVLAVPPDYTRLNSRAGILTRYTYEHYRSALTDVLPALGTHVPMPDAQIAKMYAGVPRELFRVHDWRNDVVTVGTLPAEFVRTATEGVYDKPWPAQLNRLIWDGGHDLVLSIGQVVPHEVTGMANHTKNLFVGCGGKHGIDESHFIGAAYGMERMMGRADTPVRRLLNEALSRFTAKLDIVFVLTVVGAAAPGEQGDAYGLVTRGLYIGRGTDCFEQAAKLSVAVNFRILDEEMRTVVVHLDPEEFHTTWLGNKAVYRTRMAIADGGELIVLAPGIKGFGEDPGIDALIRKYGYRATPEVMKAVRENDDLRTNLSAAAHLIHGSSEGRFTVRYCPGALSRKEIEGVGYQWGDLETMRRRFDPSTLTDGWNQVGGQRMYFISNPALGLWAYRGRIPR